MIKKDVWHALLPSGERKEEIVKEMCDNGALRNRLEEFIYDTCNTRKRAAREMLFELLGYGS